ncbi:cannabinoid receptor 1 [Biomphalaria pfeifferi]|uniref:Cannabinoid receptor 1 n=1 Tax=Biomphalaria pfeifferi TaxID=112525 RepID=A0AAD8BAS2_BIOPF|nr:cannabinoid receptor 1 [Biomphalaria pfeifferi]
MGLRKSVNMSLFAMSLSDLIGLTFQIWHNFCQNPYLENTDIPVDFMTVQILTAGCPNIAVSRITCWITMYITAERCLSVLVPFKVQRILTFRRTLIILILIYSINLSFFLPIYAADYLSWKYFPSQNMTKIGIYRWDNIATINVLLDMSHLTLSVIAFVFVVAFTSILVVIMKKSSKWRATVTFSKHQNEAQPRRENKTIGMVVMVATVLIVCYTPGVTCSLIRTVSPEFNLFAQQVHLYHVIWSFCFLFHSINSSLNVIVYYKKSSKYRKTFHELFPACKS